MSLILHRSDGETFEYDGENFYHFGIKGMKWGVRRFQNEDGSLTPAGKARYGKLAAKASKYAGQKKAARDKLGYYSTQKGDRAASSRDYYSKKASAYDKKMNKIFKKMDKLTSSRNNEETLRKYNQDKQNSRRDSVANQYSAKKGKMSRNEWVGEVTKLRSPAFSAAYSQATKNVSSRSSNQNLSKSQRIANAKKEAKIFGETFVNELEKILGPFPGTAKERADFVSRYTNVDLDDDI